MFKIAEHMCLVLILILIFFFEYHTKKKKKKHKTIDLFKQVKFKSTTPYF